MQAMTEAELATLTLMMHPWWFHHHCHCLQYQQLQQHTNTVTKFVPVQMQLPCPLHLVDQRRFHHRHEHRQQQQQQQQQHGLTSHISCNDRGLACGTKPPLQMNLHRWFRSRRCEAMLLLLLLLEMATCGGTVSVTTARRCGGWREKEGTGGPT